MYLSSTPCSSPLAFLFLAFPLPVLLLLLLACEHRDSQGLCVDLLLAQYSGHAPDVGKLALTVVHSEGATLPYCDDVMKTQKPNPAEAQARTGPGVRAC